MAEHFTVLVSIKNIWTVSLKYLTHDGAALGGKTIRLQIYYVKNYTETFKDKTEHVREDTADTKYLRIEN